MCRRAAPPPAERLTGGARTRTQPGITATYAQLIPQLATMARNLIRDLDPQARALARRRAGRTRVRPPLAAVCAAACAVNERFSGPRRPPLPPPPAQNDLQFLRIRSKESEIMVYSGASTRRPVALPAPRSSTAPSGRHARGRSASTRGSATAPPAPLQTPSSRSSWCRTRRRRARCELSCWGGGRRREQQRASDCASPARRGPAQAGSCCRATCFT